MAFQWVCTLWRIAASLDGSRRRGPSLVLPREKPTFTMVRPHVKYKALILRPRRVNDQMSQIIYRNLKFYWHSKTFTLIWYAHVEFTLQYLAKYNTQGISKSIVFLNQNELIKMWSLPELLNHLCFSWCRAYGVTSFLNTYRLDPGVLL